MNLPKFKQKNAVTVFVETDECSLLGYLLKAIDEYKQMSKMEFWNYTEWYFRKLILFVIDKVVANSYTLGTRGFSRVRREFSVLAELRRLLFARVDHYKDLTETGNRVRKVSGPQSTIVITRASYEWLYTQD